MVIAVAIAMRITLRLTPHQMEEIIVVTQVEAEAVAAQNHAGQNPVHRFTTRLPRYNHSHQLGKQLSNERQNNQIFAMYSFATLGMTAKV
ncbi:hypothetical protein HA43_11535 [Pantoea eucrina]|nr:hypothetical protein HA43_11535 [Pantoea eucrina]